MDIIDSIIEMNYCNFGWLVGLIAQLCFIVLILTI
jgi:hypothetical protein